MCSEKDKEDCNGFFVYNGGNGSALDRVCFKKDINVNNPKKEMIDPKHPNDGFYVRNN